METTYLRSNLGDGTVPPQATVDDQMRALTRAFPETEERYKIEAEETAKDLLRLQAELAKRDKAFRQLKQYCEEQQVLMETAKAQQAAELQRGHERKIDALKLANTRKAEGDEARRQVTELNDQLVATQDEARDAGVRAAAALAECQERHVEQGVVLKAAQEEVGRLTASNTALNARATEDSANLQTAQDVLASSEAARLGAVADLRNAQLAAAQAQAAHEARLSDMEDQTEQIETLTAQLKTSEKNAAYMQERAERLEESLRESNAERGTLRQRLKQADIENTQLTKRVQIQHNQRVELSVQLASARGESDTSNTRYEEALADMAICKKESEELDAANTELQARCERLTSEGMTLQDTAEAAQARVLELEAANVALQTRLADATERLEKCKKIEDLDLGQMQTLMRSNLAVAKTLDTFMAVAGAQSEDGNGGGSTRGGEIKQ